MERKTHVVAPLIGSKEIWRSASSWHVPNINVYDFANFLGLKPNSMQQYLARNAPGFPAPAVRGWRNLWTPAQIYTYVNTYRPRLQSQIPRFFPMTVAGPGPAVFLAAERAGRSAVPELQLPGCGVVSHYWQPGDGRAAIAIAYIGGPAGFIHRALGIALAAELLASMGEFVAAVAVVTDERLPVPGGEVEQPMIVVAEHLGRVLASSREDGGGSGSRVRRPARKNQRKVVPSSAGGVVTYELGWADVAGILHADLPWWPQRLRHPESIFNWHPGADTTVTEPAWRDYHPDALRALAAEAQGAVSAGGVAATELTERLVRQINASGYPAADDVPLIDSLATAEGHRPFPGITLAAISPTPCSDGQEDAAATVSDIRWLLTLPHTDRARASRAVKALQWAPQTGSLLAQCVYLPQPESDLSREWLARLRPASSEQAACFGFVATSLGAMKAAPDQPLGQPFLDPLNPGMWILRTEAGVCFTLGTRVPAAGRLTAVQLQPTPTGYVGFFRDADHTVWPMPAVGRRYSYNLGRATADTHRLADAIATLANHASVDFAVDNLQRAGKELKALVGRDTPDRTITAQQLSNALERDAAAAGPAASSSRASFRRGAR